MDGEDFGASARDRGAHAGPPQREAASVALLLAAAAGGDAAAAADLWQAVYHELKALAHQQLRPEPARAGLQTTLLVHEAYLRLVGDRALNCTSRAQFFAAAGQAMRCIRVDEARRRKALKRNRDQVCTLSSQMSEPAAPAEDPAELLALDEALSHLEATSPRAAQVVLLRHFAGLSVEETAAALDVSPRTVEMDWRLARAWLHRTLRTGGKKD